LSYKIPVGAAVETVVTWLLDHAGFLFAWLDDRIYALVVGVETILSWLPFWLFLLLAVALAWKMAGRGLALFTLLGFPLIYNLGLWTASLQTLSLIVTAQLITVVVGVPLGVFMAKNDIIDQVMRPILDFMQTMPAFVYLIPAVMFFSLGRVPGVIATIIFATPPMVRLTALGIRQVPADLIEAGQAFGSTSMQMLWKVQLPHAIPTILAGLNQSIMLALSMVVISAMIGAGGLGSAVLRGVQRVQVGVGFESGLAVVILAIYIDRLTQSLGPELAKQGSR
jgi:glycine betaine/proline transport system permease protein